jgi:hypothetical protein
MNNDAVALAAITRKKREIAKQTIERADANWRKLSRYFTQPVEITSDVSADGTGGYSQIKSKWIGLQNRGANIPDRVPKKAAVMRFTVGGRGTMVRGSLESVPPKKGTQVVFTKFAKGFRLKAGEWDKANKRDVLQWLATHRN